MPGTIAQLIRRGLVVGDGGCLIELRAMRAAVSVGLAAQPAAFRTTDATPCFTRLAQFPDELEAIQDARCEFRELGRRPRDEGIHIAGGCCGCIAAYVRALAQGVAEARSPGAATRGSGGP